MKIKNIWNKIIQEINKHDAFILYNIILIMLFVFGVLAYFIYTIFMISPYLGILILIIGFGILTWFAD